MMLFVFSLFLCHPIDNLGSDDWATREAAEYSYNALTARCLPPRSDDVETNARIYRITRRLDPLRYSDLSERRMIAESLPAWFESHVVSGESYLYDKYQVFELIHARTHWSRCFTDTYPIPGILSYSYLYGTIGVGEYDKFVYHCKLFDRRLRAYGAVLSGLYYSEGPP